MERSGKVKEERALEIIWEKMCLEELIRQCCVDTARELDQCYLQEPTS